MDPYRWLVGIDLTPRSYGALRFVRWLHDRTRGQAHRFVGIHVVESHSLALFWYPGAGPIEERARGLADAAVAAAEADPAIRVVDIVSASRASEVLRERSEGDGAGVVLGRAAGDADWSLVALGTTARRLLRQVNQPVCVVPPDLDPARLDPGPLVVALTPDDTCVDALRFATALGRQLGRVVLGAHALPPLRVSAPFPEASTAYLPFPATDRDCVRLRRAAADRVAEWLDEHELEAVAVRFEHGAAGLVTERVAERENACLIVCGSRRLDLAHRLFQTSVGTDLAAHANRPVFVVPPGSSPLPPSRSR